MTASALDDPLLAALVGKLPAPGTTWSLAERMNWLRLVVMAMNSTYGMCEPIIITDVEAPRRPISFRPVAVETGESEPARPAAAPVAPRYFVDFQGFAMRDTVAIDPEDIPAGVVLADERQPPEQGDISSVYWKTGGARDAAKLPKTIQLRAAA